MNLFLLGLPGAGKGTQAAFIAKHYNIPHISTGDMFREAIKNETELGLKAQSYMDSGELVPDQVTIGIVEERLQDQDTNNGFLLDGFPRTINQAEALDDILDAQGRSLDAALYIKVNKEILLERLTGRFICKECGATYHKINNLPKVNNTCDVCGSHEFYQRDDDKPETVKKRIQVNEDQTNALVEYYSKNNIVKLINGQQDPDEVFQEVREKLGE